MQVWYIKSNKVEPKWLNLMNGRVKFKIDKKKKKRNTTDLMQTLVRLQKACNSPV